MNQPPMLYPGVYRGWMRPSTSLFLALRNCQMIKTVAVATKSASQSALIDATRSSALSRSNTVAENPLKSEMTLARLTCATRAPTAATASAANSHTRAVRRPVVDRHRVSVIGNWGTGAGRRKSWRHRPIWVIRGQRPQRESPRAGRGTPNLPVGYVPAMFDLSGRVAVVTGAGQNVGAGIAALAASGATVHVNDIVGERADDTVAQIVDAGGAASVAPFDVTDYDAVCAAIADVGTVDILVNNAGNGGAEGMGLVQFRERARGMAGRHQRQPVRGVALLAGGHQRDVRTRLRSCHHDLVRRGDHRPAHRRVALRGREGRGDLVHAPPRGRDRALRCDREFARARVDAAGQLGCARPPSSGRFPWDAPGRPTTSVPRASTWPRTRRRG